MFRSRWAFLVVFLIAPYFLYQVPIFLPGTENILYSYYIQKSKYFLKKFGKFIPTPKPGKSGSKGAGQEFSESPSLVVTTFPFS